MPFQRQAPEVSRRVQAARDHFAATGWSYRAAAEVLGVCYQHVAAVLNGRKASAPLIRRIKAMKPRNPATGTVTPAPGSRRVDTRQRRGFALQLAEAMRAKGWNQVELSEATGITQAAISKWLRSSPNPQSIYLLRAARALEVSMEWLLTGETGDAVSTPGTGARSVDPATSATGARPVDTRQPSTVAPLPFDPSTSAPLPVDPSTSGRLPVDPSLSAGLPVDSSLSARLPVDPSTSALPPCIIAPPGALLACPFCRRADRLQRVCIVTDLPDGSREQAADVECLRCEASAPEAAWQGRPEWSAATLARFIEALRRSLAGRPDSPPFLPPDKTNPDNPDQQTAPQP